ncbi:hypothetical protein LCGC14_1935410 [marine sediment metagenome]|uniref:Uncharacterized protein n=1 Tax=marine sediment metagenome TaxID=412755 RepID=A0A0F9GA87_9ZZZZ
MAKKRPYKQRIEATQRKKLAYLKALAYGLSKDEALAQVGIPAQTFNRWLLKDTEFSYLASLENRAVLEHKAIDFLTQDRVLVMAKLHDVANKILNKPFNELSEAEIDVLKRVMSTNTAQGLKSLRDAIVQREDVPTTSYRRVDIINAIEDKRQQFITEGEEPEGGD